MVEAAAQYDLSAVTSGITDQVQAAVTTVGPIAGGLLALFVGFKVIRRLAKA
jgi:Inovirus Coat protein B